MCVRHVYLFLPTDLEIARFRNMSNNKTLSCILTLQSKCCKYKKNYNVYQIFLIKILE